MVKNVYLLLPIVFIASVQPGCGASQPVSESEATPAPIEPPAMATKPHAAPQPPKVTPASPVGAVEMAQQRWPGITPAVPSQHNRESLPPLILTGFVYSWNNSAAPGVRRKMKLSVTNQSTGEEVFATDLLWRKPRQPLDSAGNLILRNVFPEPGKFLISLRWHTVESKNVSVETEVARGDDRILLNAWFIERKELSDDYRGPKETVLMSYDLVRVTRGPGGVLLYRAWEPLSEGTPVYVVINDSERPIKGVGNRLNFFGSVQRQKDREWESFTRGGFCGTDSNPGDLLPGKSSESYEGYYIGRVESFAVGTYRYTLRYSFEERETGVPVPADGNYKTVIRSYTNYQVDDVFQITLPSRERHRAATKREKKMIVNSDEQLEDAIVRYYNLKPLDHQVDFDRISWRVALVKGANQIQEQALVDGVEVVLDAEETLLARADIHTYLFELLARLIAAERLYWGTLQDDEGYLQNQWPEQLFENSGRKFLDAWGVMMRVDGGLKDWQYRCPIIEKANRLAGASGYLNKLEATINHFEYFRRKLSDEELQTLKDWYNKCEIRRNHSFAAEEVMDTLERMMIWAFAEKKPEKCREER